jgi:hypothetical protein
MAKKRFDPKAKARKQKIVAAVLGVLFLGVMVYQAPTILGLFGGGGSEVATEPAPPPPPAAAAPAPGVAAPAAAPATGSAELVDTDVVAEPTQSQLVTFDRFESKDPFAQQAEEKAGESAPAAENAPPKDSGLSEDAGDAEPGPEDETPAEAGPPVGAEIWVNGVASNVAVGGTFPEDDPIFKLVSVTKTSAKVGIVDGTYATGSPTITLKKGGKPVTLMNTADGTTYVLKLGALGFKPKP